MSWHPATLRARLTYLLAAVTVAMREVQALDIPTWSRELIVIDFAVYSWVVIGLWIGVPALKLKSTAILLGSVAVLAGSWRLLVPGTSVLGSVVAKVAAIVLTLALLRAIRWPTRDNPERDKSNVNPE